MRKRVGGTLHNAGAGWLGFDINLEKGMISISQEEVNVLRQQLAAARQLYSMSARAVASLIGRIIAMGVGLGPVTRLRAHALYAILERRLYWSDTLALSEDAKVRNRFLVCLP